MNKYVFSLKDDQIQISLIAVNGTKVKVKTTQIIYDGALTRSFDYELLHINEDIILKTKQFVKATKAKSKSVEYVIALDSIITRTIDLPYLNAKDLKDYIQNNISTYFTINMDEYFYDYRVLEIVKATKETEKTMSIMVVVIPSAVIISMKHFTEALQMELGKMSIYPDVMSHFSSHTKNLAIIDIGSTKSIVTIFEQGKTFLFTSINHHLDDEDGFNDLIDEMEYFTDFYASRHQGTQLDALFAIGNYSDDERFLSRLKSRFNIPIDEINEKKWHKVASIKEIESYADLIASQLTLETIYNKRIDFSNETKLKKTVEREFKPTYVLLVLILITAGWFIPTWLNLDQQEQMYSVGNTPMPDGMEQTEMMQLTTERQALLDQQETLNQIETNQTNYLESMERLQSAIPKGISIASLAFDHQNIKVSFNVPNSTMDAFRLIIAINGLDYFEPLDISVFQLDDTNQSITTNLVVK